VPFSVKLNRAENHIRAGADAAMGYPRFGMIDLLKLLGGLLVGLFRLTPAPAWATWYAENRTPSAARHPGLRAGVASRAQTLPFCSAHLLFLILF
jgi:hypothetical protein